MTPAARLILDSLDAFFAQYAGTPAATEVWDVLAALRGPDQRDHAAGELKQSTTVLIRAAAFPKTAAQAFNDVIRSSFVAFHADIIPLPLTFNITLSHSPHFSKHAIDAAHALGLAHHSFYCQQCRLEQARQTKGDQP